MMEGWNNGVLEDWNGGQGMKEQWKGGMLEKRVLRVAGFELRNSKNGTMERWSNGKLGY